MRGIRSSSAGSTVFAYVSVLILVSASFSLVYLSKLNIEESQRQLQRPRMEGMVKTLYETHQELESIVFFKGLRAVEIATKDYRNKSRINEVFSRDIQDYFEREFPKETEGGLVRVENHSLEVVLLCMSTRDFMPSVNKTLISYPGVAAPSAGIDLNFTYDYNETSVYPYYAVVGYVNYTIENGGASIDRVFSCNRYMKSLYAFLESRFSRFQGDMHGTSSEIARIIRYILTNLAQYRVMQGMGFGQNNYTEILTARDVELATNLALILEEARFLRAVDPAMLSSFQENSYQDFDQPRELLYSQPNGNVPAGERTIEKLLNRYATTGCIDPADIFALYTCLDAEPLNISAVVAQPIYVLMDQMVLKYLDYLSIPNPAGDFTRQKALALFENVGNYVDVKTSASVDTGYFTSNETMRILNNGTVYRNSTLQQWFDNSTGGWHSQNFGRESTYIAGDMTGVYNQVCWSPLGFSDNYEIDIEKYLTRSPLPDSAFISSITRSGNISNITIDYIVITGRPENASCALNETLHAVGDFGCLYASAFNDSYGYLGEVEAYYGEQALRVSSGFSVV